MYEDSAPVIQNLYSINSGQSIRYVYGTDKAVARFKTDNPNAVVEITDYRQGESAGNIWDSLDNPRAI